MAATSPDNDEGKICPTHDQLKIYVYKARSRIRKLEEQNRSLLNKVQELEAVQQLQQSTAAANPAADEGEIIGLWCACHVAHVLHRSFSGTFVSEEGGLYCSLPRVCIWSDELCHTLLEQRLQ